MTQNGGKLSFSIAASSRLELSQPFDTFVIAGVSGSGKSTVGKALANRLGSDFFDGDDFHSAANKGKMSSGKPLSDDDRQPWLAALAAAIHQQSSSCRNGGRPAVFACSALKQQYRDVLAAPAVAGDPVRVIFIVLLPPVEVLQARLKNRWKKGEHFMPPSQLTAQLDDLDIDTEPLPTLDSVLTGSSDDRLVPRIEVTPGAAPLLVLRDTATPLQLVDTILEWSSKIQTTSTLSA